MTGTTSHALSSKTAPSSGFPRKKKKQVIVVTARVHPGETVSSHVFVGFLDHLLGGSKEAYTLLDDYIFKLFPALNPDGIECGNYRVSLSGCDLNRIWYEPQQAYHPEIFNVKQVMRDLQKANREILVYCDMHAHSKKRNAFFYGCSTAANGGFTSWTKVRLLPRILAKQSYMFNLKDCRFRIDPSKFGTGRVVVWSQFAVTNSFTLECSFYGYSLDGIVTTPFARESYA